MKSAVALSLKMPFPTNPEPLAVQKKMITLYQNIDHFFPDTPKRAIQFSASRTGEGTTVVAREFANVARNSFDKSVLIIDANPLHLDQCAFFDVSPKVTLLDVLRDTRIPLCDALYNVKKPDITISALARFETTFHGTFNTKSTRNLFDRLKEQFDLIVIDSAPVLSSAESVGLASGVDGIVLVMEAETTRWPVVEEAKNRILGNDGNILGLVLNKRRYYTPEFLYKIL
ncbi:MAG: AAA family ATPase [Methylococcales bacterium]